MGGENRWVSNYGLGIKILEKHLLNISFNFNIKKSGNIVRLEEESLCYAQGTEEEIRECTDCLRELLNPMEDNNIEKIKTKRKDLKKMVEELRGELQRIIFSSYLPAKFCDFI